MNQEQYDEINGLIQQLHKKAEAADVDLFCIAHKIDMNSQMKKSDGSSFVFGVTAFSPARMPLFQAFLSALQHKPMPEVMMLLLHGRSRMSHVSDHSHSPGEARN